MVYIFTLGLCLLVIAVMSWLVNRDNLTIKGHVAFSLHCCGFIFILSVPLVIYYSDIKIIGKGFVLLFLFIVLLATCIKCLRSVDKSFRNNNYYKQLPKKKEDS